MSMFKKPSKKTTLITLAVLAIAIGVFAVLEVKGITSVFNDKKVVDNTSKTTSTAPSAQSDFTTDDSDKQPAPATSKPETSVDDTSGSAVAQPTASPLVSKDGAITVYSPTSNALFTSGSSLAGKASVAKVSYRLIDDVSGVTATGALNVVSGNFSGKFNFDTRATQGRLDVFQTDASGRENSIIEIPVRFR